MDDGYGGLACAAELHAAAAAAGATCAACAQDPEADLRGPYRVVLRCTAVSGET